MALSASLCISIYIYICVFYAVLKAKQEKKTHFILEKKEWKLNVLKEQEMNARITKHKF